MQVYMLYSLCKGFLSIFFLFKFVSPGMEIDNIRETRSRRSTAGKKPIRLMDAGLQQTRKTRKSSSTTSISSPKDATMTSESMDNDEEKQTEELTRRRRLGVLRRISDSPVKKTRGRPPKMINRQIEIEARDLNDLAETTSDDVFDSIEQMTTGSGDGEIASIETTGDDAADMEVSPRDASNRKEITEHEAPRDINEVSSSTGGSGGKPDGNSCERHADETKATENGEAYDREHDSESDSEQQAVLCGGEARESPTTGGAETTRPAAATEGDDITSAEVHDITSQGQMLKASDPGDLGSLHDGSEGMSVDGGSEREANSDSGGSDRWESHQRRSDGDNMAMKTTPTSNGKVKVRKVDLVCIFVCHIIGLLHLKSIHPLWKIFSET